MNYQNTPLLDIIESINTNVKLSHEDQDLNPKQKTGWKELIYCPVCFLNTVLTTRNLKMLCPEAACIFQGIPNIGSLLCFKVLDLTKDSMVVQVADVPF